ncbi:MAG: hypothetical protein ABIK07_25490, partial [Planctomycetota bacterium]
MSELKKGDFEEYNPRCLSFSDGNGKSMKVASDFKRFTKSLSRAYPHTWFAILFLCIAICELLFLAVHDSSFWYNSYLVWYEYVALVSLSVLTWASASWLLWWIVQIARYQKSGGLGRWISTFILVIFFMSLLFVY